MISRPRPLPTLAPPVHHPTPDCDHASRIDGPAMQRIAAWHRAQPTPMPRVAIFPSVRS